MPRYDILKRNALLTHNKVFFFVSFKKVLHFKPTFTARIFGLKVNFALIPYLVHCDFIDSREETAIAAHGQAGYEHAAFVIFLACARDFRAYDFLRPVGHVGYRCIDSYSSSCPQITSN